MGISVIISSHNSARHIARVLESVKKFDEVVVCDMESTDESRDIVRSSGVKLVEVPSREDNGYLKIREYALTKAQSDWVLVLRPDEIVTPHLVRYLYDFIENPGEYKGLIIPRKNYILNRLRDNTYPDYQLRFFHRHDTTWPESRNAYPKISGRTYKIPASRGELAFIKLPRSLTALLSILNRRSTEERGKYHGHGQISTWKMIHVPISKFLKEYLLKGKIRYGTEGYVTSVNKALHLYCAMAKAHEDKSMKDFYAYIDDIIAGNADPVIPKVEKKNESAEDSDYKQ